MCALRLQSTTRKLEEGEVRGLVTKEFGCCISGSPAWPAAACGQGSVRSEEQADRESWLHQWVIGGSQRSAMPGPGASLDMF